MDINTIIKLVKKQSFDSGRNDIIDELSGSIIQINCEAFTKLLQCFSFDSGRNDAVKKLRKKLIIDDKFGDLFETMSYDSGRTDMLRDICKVKYIPFTFLEPIMDSMSFDSSKKETIKILNSQDHGNADCGGVDISVFSKYMDEDEFELVARSLKYEEEVIQAEKDKILERKREEATKQKSITLDGVTITYSGGVRQTLNVGNKKITIGEDGSISVISVGWNW